MAAHPKSVQYALFASGRGLRFLTYTGIVGQIKQSDNGTVYRNDMGYPIHWWYETGWHNFGFMRSRVCGLRSIVGNLLSSANPAVNAFAVRFQVDSDDQPMGTRTFAYDRPAQQDNAATPVLADWNFAPWNFLPGTRHSFLFASRNAAQRIERLEAMVEDETGGGGN